MNTVTYSHHMCCPGSDGACIICQDIAVTAPADYAHVCSRPNTAGGCGCGWFISEIVWRQNQARIDQSRYDILEDEVKRLRERIKRLEREGKK